MSANQQLTELIDQLVAQKTLSLDALDGIKALKDRAVRMEAELRERDTNLENICKLRAIDQNIIKELRANVERVEEREHAVAQREAKVHQIELERAVATARASTFEQAMKIVFAPNMVRNAVQGFSGGQQQGGVYVSSNENRTTTTVDGYARDGDVDAGSTAGAQPKNTL